MKKLASLLAVFTLLLLLSGSIYAQTILDQHLKDALATNPAQLEVVVTFQGNTAPTSTQKLLLNKLGILQGITFKSLPIAGVIATPAQINALAKSSLVRSLYLNRKLKYFNYNETALTGVDKIRTDAELTAKNNGMPISGKGIGVLINDSGIDATHEDLKYGTHVVQNVIGSTNLNALSSLLPVTYLENIPNTDNNSGHGTHCAGIVGGTGAKSNGKYEGVAPGASLIGYGSGAAIAILDGIGGFDYAITHQFQYNIRVITNSWGTSGTFDPNDPVNVASYLAFKRNITVLFAAGNDGPGEATNSPYAAPWVITVAAGNKDGQLADFSSRGIKGDNFTFSYNGETYRYEDRPTITAPGVDVISTRSTVAPLPALDDDADIEPAYLPFYTKMSGTSMATPHTAGIVALLLEANPSLNPTQIKDILQRTATNMPNHESWEVGAGYVNAYAAVDYAFRSPSEYGTNLNISRTFNSNANVNTERTDFTIDYYTTPELSSTQNRYNFSVPGGTTVLEVRIESYGVLEQTGNSSNLVVIAPDGTEYSSGIPVTFALDLTRSVVVADPQAGDWIVEVRGLRGDAANPTAGVSIPETITGTVSVSNITSVSGINDAVGNPAETSIKLAVYQRLEDGFSDGSFRPDENLTRIQLADYLMMGQGIRQFLPINGSSTFSDIASSDKLLVESVTAKGAALRDNFQVNNGVILTNGDGTFNPGGTVNRAELTYSLIQVLGGQAQAEALAGTHVAAHYNGQDIAIDDQGDIPSGLEGYVQLALDLNLINAYFYLSQGPYDLQPTIHAKFEPLKLVTRGDFAVIITRTHSQWTTGPLGKGQPNEQITTKALSYQLQQNYPNPFNPSTQINYSIPKDGFVNLSVYNILGEKVMTLVDGYKNAGKYSVNLNAKGLASGIYIYKISSNKFAKTMKMNLLK